MGLVLMGRAMFSKSLIQFSVDWRSCVSSLSFDLRPNHPGGSEDNGDLLQKAPRMHFHSQCPQPCSRSLLTHTSTRDSSGARRPRLKQAVWGPITLVSWPYYQRAAGAKVCPLPAPSLLNVFISKAYSLETQN